MANDEIIFKNPYSGKQRKAPVGYSWTYLFLGPVESYFRGDWKGFIASIFTSGLTALTSQVLFSFFYNAYYINELVNEGYQVVSIKNGTIQSVSKQLGGSVKLTTYSPMPVIILPTSDK